VVLTHCNGGIVDIDNSLICTGLSVISFAFLVLFSHTVLLNSIRQSRVTGVLDATNFAPLSLTQALDEYGLG
jgi:hypothetical protein